MNISPDQILLFDPGIGQINCGNGMNGGLVAVILLLAFPVRARMKAAAA